MVKQTMTTRKVMTLDGKEVMDATKPRVLIITRNDVKNAKKKDEDHCAAAVACMRQFKALRAKVKRSRVYLEFPTFWVRYEAPDSLNTEIVSFDRGYKDWEGGEFTLKAITRTDRMGERDKRKPRKPRTKADGPPKKRHRFIDVRAHKGWHLAEKEED